MTKFSMRVISIFDRRTSIRLATTEWQALDDICKREKIKRKRLFELISENKEEGVGFTCSVRLFVIAYMRALMNSELNFSGTGSNYPCVSEVIKLIA